MKRKFLLLISFFICCCVFAQAPKREFRATWLQTVYSTDWPRTSKITTPGGTESQINAQKNAMKNILDQMVSTNMNAACFQARSRSDAMYRSSYEPWSSDLVSTRGMDPGYDPLEFVVEECHARGIECHVWINPYRYESSIRNGRWDQLEIDYRNSHPEWIIEVGDKSILNPGLPEVREHIVNIIREIIINYDIDGILFDDYFYLENISNEDLEAQLLYKKDSQSLGDWRRENINMLMADIYDMIQELKPYLRFGISPAGIWGGDAAHQEKYGITNPSGISGGYAFNGIYCDPLAWLSEGTIDYISPQIYWGTSAKDKSESAYEVLAPWWTDAAHKFDRHCYVSHHAGKLVHSSYDYANQWPYEELNSQIEVNRKSDHYDAPGSIYFNTTFFLGKHKNESVYLRQFLADGLYSKNTLVPAMHWKEYNELAVPQNIQVTGSTLKWDPLEGVRRYAIYAIPNEKVSQPGNFATSEYLLGVCYGNEYELATNLISTHKFGVAALDNYANEFAPNLMGYVSQPNEKANLVAPADNGVTTNPAFFSWDDIEGAEYYVLEVSLEEEFSSVLGRYDITNNYFASASLKMEEGVDYYWRIRTRKIGVEDEISETRTCKIKNIEITYPVYDAASVSLTPEVEWIDMGEGFRYVVQVSSNQNFTNTYEYGDLEGTSYQLPLGSVYAYSTNYVRVKAVNDLFETVWSAPVRFSTLEEYPAVPVIISPSAHETVTTENVIIKWEENAYAQEFTLQVSEKETFPYAGRITRTGLKGFEYSYEIEASALTPNTTYFARVRAKTNNFETDWSPVISFLYIGNGSGIWQNNKSDFNLTCSTLLSGDVGYIQFTTPYSQSVRLYICDTTGKKVADLFDHTSSEGLNYVEFMHSHLAKGIYLLVFETREHRETVKLIK